MVGKVKSGKDKRAGAASFLLLVMLSVVSATVSAQHLSIRNNLFYDAALTPNIGFDVRTAPHWSWGLNAGFRPWPASDMEQKKWRHLLLASEVRRWNTDQHRLRLPRLDSLYRSHSGYWGVNFVYSHFNVGGVKFPFGVYKSVRHNRMQGDLAAVGLFYGHTWRLTPLLRLEAEAGLGMGYAWAEKYDCPHCGAYLGRDDKPFLLPKLALNIVLDAQKRRQTVAPVPVAVTDTLPVDIVVPAEPPVLSVGAVKPATTADQLWADNPVLAEYKDYRPYDRTRILRKEKGALYVHFPVGSAALSHDFRDNAATLDRIVAVTRQIMADTASNVRLIQIIGLASIEGSVNANERLAQSRAEALKRYIQQQVQTPDSIYELCNGGEAWTELRDQLNDVLTAATASAATAAPASATCAPAPSVVGGSTADASSLRQALDIIDSEPDLSRREQRLRQLNGGRTFRYIHNELLPQQRNSGYLRIYFDRVPDERAATINEAAELLRTDCHDCHARALQLLLPLADDQRAWNALGVALYLNGHSDEAVGYFRRAAQNGNADAVRNLKETEK